MIFSPGFDSNIEAHMEEEGSFSKGKHSCKDDLMEVFCPCCRRYDTEVKATPQVKVKGAFPKEKEKDPEAAGKLLEVQGNNGNSQNGGVPQGLGLNQTGPEPSAVSYPQVVSYNPQALSTQQSLDAHDAAAIYRSRPSPSAPAADHDVIFSDEQLQAMRRQCSYPVQATT